MFDPRPEKEDELLAVCNSCGDKPQSDESCTLVRYCLTEHQVTAAWNSTPVSSSSLSVFCGGERVVAIRGKSDHPAYRKVLVLEAEALDLLHELPLVPTANIGGITPIYSVSQHFIALITWKKFSGKTLGISRRSEKNCNGGEDEATSPLSSFRRQRSFRHLCPIQVAVYKVPLDMSLVRLQGLACAAILRLTRPCEVVNLPLPVSLRQMLANMKRF